MKILIVGTINNFCLETSYANAAQDLGYEVVRFDPSSEVHRFVRLGKVGWYINELLPIEVWYKKMNRQLIIYAKDERPDEILLVGGAKIYYGTLATIKAILPSCKIAWIWPDTPMNLNANNLGYARLLDLSAIYSKASLGSFQSLGFSNPHWIPLAGDLSMHYVEIASQDKFDCDISFVGMWRPERERFMSVIVRKFSHLRIEVHGNYWKRNCADKELLSKWKGNGFYAKELSNHFSRSRINMNIIDDTNYPAANMRFFEIPTSGGLQLCTRCPELEDEFVDKRDIVYFNDEEQLVERLKWILAHPEEASKIRSSGQGKIQNKHNYMLRLKSILKILEETN